MLVATLVGAIGCSDRRAAESCAESKIGAPPNCFPKPPAPAAPGKSWHVVYAEEFDGDGLDHEKLTPCFDWNYNGGCTSTFNKGRETYRPEQVRVSDGTAKLVAEPLSPPEPNEACYENVCTYKSGLISTARPTPEDGYLFPFTYGYIESRLKFPAIPGFFTAFWMLPTNPDYEYRNEIDIAEILGGEPNTLYMTYHHGDRKQEYRINQGDSNGACPTRDYSQDWVRIGLDWQPDHIAWYVNGVKCGEFTDSAQIENGPMQFIMNLMVDNEWERDVGSVVVDPKATGQVEVDYIRIYQQQ